MKTAGHEVLLAGCAWESSNPRLHARFRGGTTAALAADMGDHRTDPTAEQVRQLILAGEPTFSRPKRFPKGSMRITPQPTVPYFEIVERVALETKRASQPSILELLRILACASLLVFAISLAIFVAAR